MTAEFISATRNGAPEQGTVLLMNEETNPLNGESFVSKVCFVPATPFNTSDEVILAVNMNVLSYADICMAEDFVRRVEIENEPKEIMAPGNLNVPYDEEVLLEISVMPKEVVAGKKITARSVIVAVAPEAMLDAEGKTKLRVRAELPGTAIIYIALDGTDLTAETKVNVAMPVANIHVAEEEIDFGNMPIGSSSEVHTALLTTDILSVGFPVSLPVRMRRHSVSWTSR